MVPKPTTKRPTKTRSRSAVKPTPKPKPTSKPKPKPTSKAKPKATKLVAPVPKLPTVALKPKVASKPSTPLPPPPPPPPATRDELGAPRDIARLLRYGERFGDKRIDIRMQPQLALPITGAIAIFDPTAPRNARVFDRPTGPGNFRVMLSVAVQDGKPERLAALIIHVGRPPIARWTVAHYARDKKPKSPDALPRLATSGWLAVIDGATTPAALPTSAPTSVVPVVHGAALAVPSGTGEFAAYWAVDATDKPICLVIDFDVLTAKDWKAKPAS